MLELLLYCRRLEEVFLKFDMLKVRVSPVFMFFRSILPSPSSAIFSNSSPLMTKISFLEVIV
jgi:hypothetical protein